MQANSYTVIFKLFTLKTPHYPSRFLLLHSLWIGSLQYLRGPLELRGQRAHSPRWPQVITFHHGVPWAAAFPSCNVKCDSLLLLLTLIINTVFPTVSCDLGCGYDFWISSFLMWQAMQANYNFKKLKEFIWDSGEQPASKEKMDNGSLGRIGLRAVSGIALLGRPGPAHDSAKIIYPPRVCLFESQILGERTDLFRIIHHGEEQMHKEVILGRAKAICYIIP